MDDGKDQEMLLKFIADQDLRIQQLEKLLNNQSTCDIGPLERMYKGAVKRAEDAERENRNLSNQLANKDLQIKSLQARDETKCDDSSLKELETAVA